MANVFKYLTGSPSRKALKKGNLARGIGGQDYGPTSSTGYYAGVIPPEGGYLVTTLRGGNIPDYRVSPNEEGLITIANELGGNVSTVNAAKTYIASRNHTWISNSPTSNKVTDGLTSYIEASNMASYPETGTTAYDLSGNSRNWTITGATWNSNGWWDFDGANDYIQRNDIGVNPDTSDTSIEIVFKTDRLNVDQAIFSDNWGPEYGLWTRSNGNLQYTAYASKQTSINTDRWYHAVITIDPGATKNSNVQTYIKSYLNGSYLGQSNANTGNGLNDTPFSLGRDPRSAAYFDGSIASLKTYNRQLTAEEVTNNYYKANLPSIDNLVLYLDPSNPVCFEPGKTNCYNMVTGGIVTGANGNPGSGTHTPNTSMFPAYNSINGGIFDFSGGRGMNVDEDLGSTTTRTFIMWFYKNSSNTQYFSDARNNGGQWFLSNYTNDNINYTEQLTYNFGGSYNASNSSFLNQWICMAVTSDGSGSKLYLNGELIESGNRSSIDEDFGKNFRIGTRYTTSSHWTGYMGPIMAYNKVLDNGEISQIFNAHRERFGV